MTGFFSRTKFFSSPGARDLAAHGFMLAFLAILTAPLWGPNYFFLDACRYPIRAAIFEDLGSGELPLWTELIHAGTSTLGQFGGAWFYPPTWLFAVLPVPVAQRINSLLPLALAAAFGFWLLRRLGCGRAAAVVAGLGYATSAFVLGDAAQGGSSASAAAWLPAVLGSVVALGENRFRAGIASIALAYAMVCVAGSPRGMLWVALLTLTLALLHPRAPASQRGVRIAATLAGLTLGALTAAPALLPAFEAYRVSRTASLAGATTDLAPSFTTFSAGGTNALWIQVSFGMALAAAAGLEYWRRRIVVNAGSQNYFFLEAALLVILLFVQPFFFLRREIAAGPPSKPAAAVARFLRENLTPARRIWTRAGRQEGTESLRAFVDGNFAALSDLPNAGGCAAMMPARLAEGLESGPLAIPLDLLGVEYLVTHASREGRRLPADLSVAGESWEVVLERDGIVVARNPDPLPVAWLVPAWRTLDRDAVSAALRSGRLDDGNVWDPRTLALLEPPAAKLAGEARETWGEARGEASVASWLATRQTLTAYSPGDSILIVSARAHPGWQVRVDGQAAPLLTVDSLLRGVRLEPGSHQIDFAYRPESFRYGVGGGLLGLVLATALLVRSRATDESG